MSALLLSISAMLLTTGVGIQTVQPFCAAGMANGPMPAIMSTTTCPALKVSTRRLCSCSSREFQYTAPAETSYDHHTIILMSHNHRQRHMLAAAATCRDHKAFDRDHAEGRGVWALTLFIVEPEARFVLLHFRLKVTVTGNHFHLEDSVLIHYRSNLVNTGTFTKSSTTYRPRLQHSGTF